MDLSSNTVLITGGASGIGFALAERFLSAGSEVIVCGRREEKLREAQERIPQTSHSCLRCFPLIGPGVVVRVGNA